MFPEPLVNFTVALGRRTKEGVKGMLDVMLIKCLKRKV